MAERDVVTWNTMIGAYRESGHSIEPFDLYLKMKQEGFQPDAITYLSVLSPSPGALEFAKQVHIHVQGAGFVSDLRVASALVHMYTKSGSVDDARLLLNRTKERDVIIWTAMIGGYAESGCGEEAYRLFLQMKREVFTPDEITSVSVLNACASAGNIKWVNEVRSHVVQAGCESDLRVSSALIHSYAKSGSIDGDRRVLKECTNVMSLHGL